MDFAEREFIPVLLGGDINVYSMARAFFERYAVRSRAFGKFRSGPANRSGIIEYTPNPAIDTDETFLRLVNGFARAHSNKKILLMGCGDNYVSLIVRHRDAGDLERNIVAPYSDLDLIESCQKKEVFYHLCEQHGVAFPRTFTFRQSMLNTSDGLISALDALKFPFPVILKPSDGIMYWEHPFATQKKAYSISTREELERTIRDIYRSGYTDELIIQDKVPGGDERMRVLTSYSGADGRVRMMCLGHVLLEEHSPHAVGNHAAIITESNESLAAGVRKLLEDLRYVGFANFDVKYDERDATFRFLDFNTRQGRSNYYVTASGLNLASYVVDEYVYEAAFSGEPAGPSTECLWHVVPKGVISTYVGDDRLKERARELARSGRSVNPVFMRGDFDLNRWLHAMHTYMGQYKMFRRYYG
ncbi:hypothetical protein Corgl_0724 [Coriobacterium glomerans PW2]|uniref:ATP-grasp domain-containing protein n=1 Tax=Coriobacterium glomerans (strain ATCC 49209 / DSM 20642 / JCM 10262 / PW2) TaxID=700015 RepID=F2NBM9_CORGP|nr:hypothetical protein [Coriobacterium glomerans]AEB06838.1 hypothetical protein Corgl_0724 [Coriobacterium glomerans PW2]